MKVLLFWYKPPTGICLAQPQRNSSEFASLPIAASKRSLRTHRYGVEFVLQPQHPQIEIKAAAFETRQ